MHLRQGVTQRIVNFRSVFQEGAALAGYGDMRVNLNRYLRGMRLAATVLSLNVIY